MKYFIGADLGTSSVKLILLSLGGEIVKSTVKYYSVSYPRPGWSEQSPTDWWQAFADGVRELSFGVSGISDIAVAGQMHGLVLLDDADKVIRPMFFEYPEDGRCYTLDSRYMFGEDIIFAPIVNKGQTVKSVYIPDGEWILTKDKTVYTKGTYEITAEINEFVAFVRKGADVINCF